MNANLSKEQIKATFKELSAFKSKEEYLENEAMMLHFRIMQLAEQAMERKGRNKKQLAEKLDTSQSYITQLFMGSKMLNLQMMSRLQDMLDMNFKLETESANKNQYVRVRD